MKYLTNMIITLFIFTLLYGCTLNTNKEDISTTKFEQNNLTQYVGKYENKTGKDAEFVVEYELTLNIDGTFLFHFYQDQICYVENERAKGKWKIENGIIIFEVNKSSDIDKNHKYNFNNTKAKVNGGVLTFFDCEVIWLNDIKLKKK